MSFKAKTFIYRRSRYLVKGVAVVVLVLSFLSLNACGNPSMTAYETLQKAIEQHLEKTGQVSQSTLHLTIQPEYQEGYTPEPETEAVIQALNGLDLQTDVRSDRTTEHQEMSLKGSFPYEHQTITFNIDLMDNKDTVYLRLKDLSIPAVPEIQPFLPLFLNKWIKLDAKDFSQIDAQQQKTAESNSIRPQTLNKFISEAFLAMVKALGPEYFSLLSVEQKAPPAIVQQKASSVIVFHVNKETFAEMIKRLSMSFIPALYDILDKPEYIDIKKMILEQDSALPKSKKEYETMLQDHRESFEKNLVDFQKAVDGMDIEMIYWLNKNNLMVGSESNINIVIDAQKLEQTTDNSLNPLSKLTVQFHAEENIELFDGQPPFRFDDPPAKEETIDLGALLQSFQP